MRRSPLAVLSALVITAAVSGAQASSAPVASPNLVRASGQPFLVGAVEDAVNITDYATAKTRMDALKAAGFTAIKINKSWIVGQAEAIHDFDSVCTAARAAAADGLTLILDVTPWWNKKDPSQHPPWTAPENKMFGTTLAYYLDRLARTHGPDNPIPDCVPGQTTPFYFEIGNEPNYGVFWPQQNSRGDLVAPAQFIRTLAWAYRSLHTKAAELDKKVMVISGGVTTSHEPVKFVTAMGRAAGPACADLGLNPCRVFDWFGCHPYPASGSPPTSGLSLCAKVRASLGAAFGWLPPVLYDELGIQSQIDSGMLQPSGPYTGQKPTTVHPVPETQQGAYYRQYYLGSFCQPGVVGALQFKAFDSPQIDSDWQSGIYYAFDPRVVPADQKFLPKIGSYGPVTNAISQILTDPASIDCSTFR